MGKVLGSSRRAFRRFMCPQAWVMRETLKVLNCNSRAPSREVTLKQGPKGCIKGGEERQAVSISDGKVGCSNKEDQLGNSSSSHNRLRYFWLTVGAGLTQSFRDPDCGASALFYTGLPRWPQEREANMEDCWGEEFCGLCLEVATICLLMNNAGAQPHQTARRLGNVEHLGVPRRTGRTDLGGEQTSSAHSRESTVTGAHRANLTGDDRRRAGKCLTTGFLEGNKIEVLVMSNCNQYRGCKEQRALFGGLMNCNLGDRFQRVFWGRERVRGL